MLFRVSTVLVLLLLAIPILAQELPILPEELPIDVLGEIGNAEVNAPPDLSSVGLPEETGTQLFSYAKWLFYPSTAQELLGETLAPIAINLYVYLGIVIALAIIGAAIKTATLALKFLLFIADWIRKLIELIPIIQ